MKKIILLIIVLLTLTGCKAEYNLVYENDIFKEKLVLTSLKNDIVDDVNVNYNRNYFVNYKLQLGDMSESDYISKYGGIYNKNIIDENNNYGMKLSYDFNNKEEYLNSSIVFNLFEKFYISSNLFEATNIKNIFDNYTNLEEIKVIYNTDKNIISRNDDEKIDGKYYWYINKDNYKNKEILIRYDENKDVLVDNDGYFTGNIIKYVLMFLAIVILIGIVIIYEKIRKSNN